MKRPWGTERPQESWSDAVTVMGLDLQTAFQYRFQEVS